MRTATAPDLETIGARLQALSDPHRLRILDRLRGGERCVCELTDVLDTGQSLLSFHLKVLRDAGLVTARREGRWMHYALDTGILETLEDFLHSLRRRTSEARWKPVCCE
jgi:ArsR family transcriptional regulator